MGTAATVSKVVDGYAVDIRDDVRNRLRVRVLEIDTAIRATAPKPLAV
jgi:hypothetical protein